MIDIHAFLPPVEDQEMVTIAKKLGYLTIREASVESKSIDTILVDYSKASTRHYYLVEVYDKIIRNKDEEVCKQFLELKKCLRCAQEYESTLEKPYCSTCYRSCMQMERFNSLLVMATEQEVEKERTRFSWVADLPKHTDDDIDCMFCQHYCRNPILWYNSCTKKEERDVVNYA